jgi:Ca2+-transporting ATPase
MIQYHGLTSEEVVQSRAEHGANMLPPPVRESWWRAYFEKFNDPIIRILMIAALLATVVGAAHGDYTEGIAIIVTIFLATFIAFWNERRAAAEFDILNRVNDDIEVRVIRDGRPQKAARKDLVVGDIILLENGEEVPADAELLETQNLEADEAKLTGESHPVVKQRREDGELPNTTYPSYLVLKSTLIADGHGVFVVRGVGEKSEIGAVAQLSSEDSGIQTPLAKQLDGLAKVLSVVAFSVAGVLFAVLFGQGMLERKFELAKSEWAVLAIFFAAALILLHRIWLPIACDFPLLFGRQGKHPSWLRRGGLLPWVFSLLFAGLIIACGCALLISNNILSGVPGEWLSPETLMALLTYFMIAVALIVVAIPEGLPLAVTLSLAYNMRKMVANNALVRRLYACETIGAVTVICSDKTGTLTANEMRVAALDSRVQNTLLAISIAGNSTALLEKKEGEESKVLGNPTEGALLLWLEAQGISYEGIREENTGERQWTFTTERKFMATIVKTKEYGRLLLVKGAPEYVMMRSSCIAAYAGSADKAAIEATEKNTILADIFSYQKRGMRTIGFAARRLQDNESGKDELEGLAQGLEWLGFAAIEDPVRAEVPAAIGSCMSAGIAVKVVTGDTPETAREIARRIGLWQEEDEQKKFAITTGDVFEAWTEEELEERAKGLKILARARPKDKLRLVQCLQRLGEVVAVTGDGTNDAPALNHADVGLAMGKTGTAVSKEASDIVLLDDSFASIVRAILWGRSIYLNIQHFLIFQLTINLTAVCIALLGPFLGTELPFTVIQILWINLIMDTLAALAFATEPPDDFLLTRPPRKHGQFIITKAMAGEMARCTLVFLAVLIPMMLFLLDGSVRWLTIFFTFFVLLQVWNMMSVRFFGRERISFAKFFKNRAFWIVAFAIILGQVAIVEFGGKVFRTEPLSILEWLSLAAAGSVVFIVGEISRLWGRMRAKRCAAR